MSKKKQKTYNHYVPQFYLKNFSGNDSIGRYNFARKEFVNETAIRNTAGRDFLYGKNSDLEDWFQNLEGVWATIIRNILLYEKIPMDSAEYTYLLMFVYLSDVRTAETADEFKRIKLEEGKNVARILANQGKIEISNGFIESLDVQIDRPNLSYIQGMKELIDLLESLAVSGRYVEMEGNSEISISMYSSPEENSVGKAEVHFESGEYNYSGEIAKTDTNVYRLINTDDEVLFEINEGKYDLVHLAFYVNGELKGEYWMQEHYES